MAIDHILGRFCRGCGCTENNACVMHTPQGRFTCAWVLLDLATPTGVCSGCAIKMGWDQDGLQLIGFAPADSEPAGAPMALSDFAGAEHTRTLVLP
jgi:hypothetical protein